MNQPGFRRCLTPVIPRRALQFGGFQSVARSDQDSIALGLYLFSVGQTAQRPAPKGLEDSAQGFNQVSMLGTNQIKRFALKGREERANETYHNDTLRSCG
jgi:hypothetical protein